MLRVGLLIQDLLDADVRLFYYFTNEEVRFDNPTQKLVVAVRNYAAELEQMVLEEGPPFLSIGRAVQRLRPHLLVVGTHGRSGLTRALLGSVAERVISEIECDILTVPRMAGSA